MLNKIGRAVMIDPNTGDEIELDGIDEIIIEPLEPIEVKTYKIPCEYNFSMDNVKISDDLIKMLLPPRKIYVQNIFSIKDFLKLVSLAQLMLSLPPSKSEIVGVTLKQARTHKKKRINKKWAKRYGYEVILYIK